MPINDPMICPECKTQMNRHAAKLVYIDPGAGSSMDAATGGRIAEFHTCPGCGSGASRPA